MNLISYFGYVCESGNNDCYSFDGGFYLGAWMLVSTSTNLGFNLCYVPSFVNMTFHLSKTMMTESFEVDIYYYYDYI